jgi:hypothetical protein
MIDKIESETELRMQSELTIIKVPEPTKKITHSASTQ